MHDLIPGANAPLAGAPTIVVGVTWMPAAPAGMDIDTSGFLLGPEGKVPSDEYFVFYGATRSPCDSVTLFTTPKSGDRRGQHFVIELAKVPSGVEEIAICLTIHEGLARSQHFGMLQTGVLSIASQGGSGDLIRFQMRLDGLAETALILGRFYRRGSQWKFRAVGQGFLGGLPALARHYGVQVQEDSPADQPAPPPAPPPEGEEEDTDTFRWIKDGEGRYVGVSSTRGELRAGAEDVDLFGIRLGGCGCSPVYPVDTEKCPLCGGPLQDRNGFAGQGPNNGAYAHAGLPRLTVNRRKREEVALPAGSDFVLFGLRSVPGPMLLARNGGLLWRYSHTKKDWVLTAQSLPAMDRVLAAGWSFAAIDDVLVFPTDTTLETFIHVPGRLKRVRHTIDGHPAGGAVLMNVHSEGGATKKRCFVVPVMANGGLMLACRDTDRSAPWSMVPVAKGDSAGGALGVPALGIGCAWPGQEGYLHVIAEEEVVGRWRAYKKGFQPFLDHPPLIVERGGASYQLGAVNGHSFGLHELSLRAEGAALHTLPGAVLCAGHLCYKVRQRFARSPWEPDPIEDHELLAGEEDFVCPVAMLNPAQSVIAVAADRTKLSKLATGETLEDGVRAEVCLATGSSPRERLGMIVSLRHIRQLRAAVSDGRLWVYDRLANRMNCWPLM